MSEQLQTNNQTNGDGIVALDPVRYSAYMRVLRRVIKHLRAYYKQEEGRGTHEEDSMRLYAQKFLNTVTALRIKHTHSPVYLGRPSVDLTDSGFPQSYDIGMLTADLSTKTERLPKIPSIEESKQAFLNHLLSHPVDPERQVAFERVSANYRWQVAERAYLEMLDLRELFFQFTPGKLFLATETEWRVLNKRRAYHFSWGCYDNQTNRPYVYFMLFEQDASEAPLDAKDNPEYVKFLEAIQHIAGRAPANLRAVAVGLDEAFTSLYPKFLKRICIGPLVSPMLYQGIDGAPKDPLTLQILSVFERGELESDDFVLFFSTELLWSDREEDAPKSFLSFGKSKARQIFYVPKNDQRLLRRGSSLVKGYALMPHRFRQHLSQEDIAGIPGFAEMQFLVYQPDRMEVTNVG